MVQRRGTRGSAVAVAFTLLFAVTAFAGLMSMLNMDAVNHRARIAGGIAAAAAALIAAAGGYASWRGNHR